MNIKIDPLVVNLARTSAMAFMAFDEKHPNNDALQEKARLVVIRLSAIIVAARRCAAEDRNRGGVLAQAIEAADAALKTGEP